MAITSGVRAPRAQITIGGQSFNVISARVNQEATRRLFHVLHMAYEESKKLADDLLDEDEE